jgi:hypothetical protein
MMKGRAATVNDRAWVKSGQRAMLACALCFGRHVSGGNTTQNSVPFG